MEIKKILVTIFIVLLLIIVSEAGYMFFLYQQVLPTTTSEIATAFRDIPKVGKTVVYNYTEGGKNYTVTSSDFSSRALKAQGVLKSSTLTSELEGKIGAISTQGGIVQFTNESPFQYKVRLTFKLESGGVYPFFWNEYAMERTQVVQESGIKQVPISIDQLRVGDKVRVTITVSLSRPFETNVESILIVKLK